VYLIQKNIKGPVEFKLQNKTNFKYDFTYRKRYKEMKNEKKVTLYKNDHISVKLNIKLEKICHVIIGQKILITKSSKQQSKAKKWNF